MKLPTLDQADLKGKKVFVRGDIDVPLTQQLTVNSQQLTVADDIRLKDIWPTIQYLLDLDCKLVLAGHLGRPQQSKSNSLSLSSRPVAEWMARQESRRVGKQESSQVSGVCLKGNICGFYVDKNLTVLENLRFDPREEANDEVFAKDLASLADVYVNEAFATSWEVHASIVGVPRLLPHFAGFRLAKEIEILDRVLNNPTRPLVAIIGGAKLESKGPVIMKMAEVADTVVVGGKILEEMRDDGYGEKVKKLKMGEGGKDATLESVDEVADHILRAKTIVWSGPLGVIEEVPYQVGTRRMAELITANTKAYKVVGGGDTVAFIDKLGLIGKFDWVSTGGGSMLKLLAGEKLPGVEALLIPSET